MSVASAKRLARIAVLAAWQKQSRNAMRQALSKPNRPIHNLGGPGIAGRNIGFGAGRS